MVRFFFCRLYTNQRLLRTGKNQHHNYEWISHKMGDFETSGKDTSYVFLKNVEMLIRCTNVSISALRSCYCEEALLYPPLAQTPNFWLVWCYLSLFESLIFAKQKQLIRYFKTTNFLEKLHWLMPVEKVTVSDLVIIKT